MGRRNHIREECAIITEWRKESREIAAASGPSQNIVYNALLPIKTESKKVDSVKW